MIRDFNAKNREQNIFQECRYDAYNFFKIHKEQRELTPEEIRVMKAFCETMVKYGRGQDCVLGPGVSSCSYAIFKIEDGAWIIWQSDERRGFFDGEKFDNVEVACIRMLKRIFEVEDRDLSIEYFKSLLAQEMTEADLKEFAEKTDYTIVLDYTRKLQKNSK